MSPVMLISCSIPKSLNHLFTLSYDAFGVEHAIILRAILLCVIENSMSDLSKIEWENWICQA